VFIFPSAEVAGLVWIEALACGLPVVAFDGLTEVAVAARRLPGIFVAANEDMRHRNITNYARAIMNSSLHRAEPGLLRSAVLDNYGWNSVTDTILREYDNAIEIIGASR
jgi:glycosyltransferase involved in cell wall biosynthesis